MKKISIFGFLIIRGSTPMERRYVSHLKNELSTEYQTFVKDMERDVKSKFDELQQSKPLPNAITGEKYRVFLPIPLEEFEEKIKIEDVKIKRKEDDASKAEGPESNERGEGNECDVKSELDESLTSNRLDAPTEENAQVSISNPTEESDGKTGVEGVEIEGDGACKTGWHKWERLDKGRTIRIKGTPTQSGEFELEICYCFEDQPSGKHLFPPIPLTIKKDNHEMWPSKGENPTPENIEYYKTDTDEFFIKSEKGTDCQKNLIAASTRGRSHAYEGKPRDDHFKADYMKETRWYIIAVADGAGSAKYSRRGSEIACETVVKHCQEKLRNPEEFEEHIRLYQESTKENKDGEKKRKDIGDDLYNILVDAAYKAYGKIESEATQKGNQLKDYATTLLVSICKKFEKGWFVATFWIGDGAICLYRHDDLKHEATLLGLPDEGEYAGQTRFLTMPDILGPGKNAEELYKRLRFRFEPDITALFLMTDGVSDPIFETDANLGKVEYWDDLWDDLKEEVISSSGGVDESPEKQLLEWLDFWSRGNHDDRTIAILY